MFKTCVIAGFNLVQAYFIINVKASPERGAADLLNFFGGMFAAISDRRQAGEMFCNLKATASV
jgi:hypothetical protein